MKRSQRFRLKARKAAWLAISSMAITAAIVAWLIAMSMTWYPAESLALVATLIGLFITGAFARECGYWLRMADREYLWERDRSSRQI